MKPFYIEVPLRLRLVVYTLMLGCGLVSEISAQTLKLKYNFEDTGTTTTNFTSGLTLNIFNGITPADFHGTAGSGVAGSGKALDFSSATYGNASSPLAFVTNSSAASFGLVSNFTMTQWIKPDTLANFPRFFIIGTNTVAIETATNSFGYLLNNGASFQVFLNGIQRITSGAVPGLAAGSWSFIAITYDGANLNLYAGSPSSAVALVATAAVSGAAINFGASGSVILGNRLTDRLRAFDGMIDDTRFYTGAADTNFLNTVRAEALPPLFALATTITPNPASVGSTVIISATTGGVLPIIYRWRYTDTNGVTTFIAGATNSTYVVPEVQFANAGAYSLIMSNNTGVPAVLTNTSAMLTVMALSGVEIQNLGTTAPTPTGSDIYQLGTAGNTQFPPTGVQATGLNYYSDNVMPPGQTFTTGSNTNGYLLASLLVKWGGIEGSHASGNPYTLRIYSVLGTAATLLSTYTNDNLAPVMSPGDWTKWIGLSNQLSPNTTYAYSIGARSADGATGAGYMQVANASGNQYSGGQLGLFPAASGTVTFGATGDYDASFLVHLLSDGSDSGSGSITNARPPMAAFLNNIMPETAPTTSANWAIVPAFANLVFTNVLGILPVPGTNLLCVFEREGRVWTFVNNSNTSTKTLVLDISGQCQGWDDSGLMNVAFHPGFVTNGFMYVYYTWVTNGTVVGSPTTRPTEYSPGKYHDRLSRFTMTNGLSTLASELVLVDQSADSVWHNGSGLFFHPANGFLYWTDGDDERYPTQTITNNLLSGVFRIDVDQRGGSISHPIPRQPKLGTTANYYIPNDNPFVGVANAMEEFFCLGLRSPHRMTIDPPTGKIYLGDVGDSSREEIDVMLPGESGLNFQWSRIEGLNGDLTPPYIGINRRPVLDYTHTEGNAVIGGHVYRGSEFAAELGGRYIFGDNVARKIWVMDESTTPATKLQIGTIPAGAGPNSGSSYVGLSSFGLDANGEIYMCQMSSVGGQIYKLARGTPTASRPLPALLSQTGVFTNLATLAPNPGLIPYTVNSPLWSDAAVKTRWMALATNAFVTFMANGEWSFPNGVVFVKNFALATNDTNPSQLKRLETRLLVIGTNGLAYGAGYKWRADNSDADLVPTLTNEDITITTATGTRTQTWSYPGRSDCLTCHTIPAGGVLGVKTRQLNGNYAYPVLGTNDNQLRVWNQYNLFSQPINEAAIPAYSKTVPISDTNATLAVRVRSYLDANCAQCHRPGGGVQANFDARFDTPLASQGLVSGAVQNSQGISNVLVVTPGDLVHSLLYLRDNNVGTPLQMPPLAKNTIDTNYIAVLAQWINTLVPPTVSAIADITIPINSATGPVPFTVGDASVAPGSLVVTGTSSRTTLVPDANIVFGGSGSNRTVNVTPLAGQFGSVTITVRVDNGIAPVSETFVVTVPGLLVGWYKFEGNAQDSSGFANHGTTGGTFSYLAGKVDTSAISFDGTTGYTQIPLSVSNDFTLALWVKTTDTGGGSQWWAGKGLLDGEMAGAGNDFGTALVGAKAAFGVGNPDTTIVSTTSINDGSWHHVAATRNSVSGEIKLYLDGTVENSLVTSATGVRTPANLRIGSIRTGTTGSFLAGSIDDARIYNYVMNGNEIGALLNTPPVLTAIPNRVIMAGTVLNITNFATDASAPPQILTFTLAGTPPVGATINPSNGIFNWRPTVAQGGTTNLFTIQVADNGAPTMTAEKSFSVAVNRPALPGLSNASIVNGEFRLTIAGDFGPDYTVLGSTNLTSWISVFTTNQPTLPFVFGDPNLTNYNQRFYRVRLDP